MRTLFVGFTALLLCVFFMVREPIAGAKPNPQPAINAWGTSSTHTHVEAIYGGIYRITVVTTFQGAPSNATITAAIYDPINLVWVAGTVTGGGTVYHVTNSAGGAIFYYDVAASSAWGTWIAGNGATTVFASMWNSSGQLIASSEYEDAYLE